MLRQFLECASISLAALAFTPIAAFAAEASGAPFANEGSPPPKNIELTVGSGTFAFAPVKDPGKLITVHYHRPHTFHGASNILIVVPGAGRNADEYRDHWIVAAEKHGVLILAPEYPESDYDLAAYHFGGVVKNLELIEPRIERSTRTYYVKDENIRLDFNPDRSRWLFNDFDRMFELAAAAVQSSADHYDIFGHSAGGQILHRMAVFHPKSKARRIVAANSGFYTTPGLDVRLPFGLQGTDLNADDLQQSFKSELIVFLGERDDERETRGIHLRTPRADSMGIGRYARGRHFFETSRQAATQLNVEFRWKLHVVPDVGHDAAAMSRAAADYLYEEDGN